MKISQLEDRHRLTIDRDYSVYLGSKPVIAMLVNEPRRHVGKRIIRYLPLCVVVDTHIAEAAAYRFTCAPFKRQHLARFAVGIFDVRPDVVIGVCRGMPGLLFVEIDSRVTLP